MKPLGYKSYGSIPHLPRSKVGAGDHHIEEGQAAIAVKRTRDRHDLVIVQEKLDGSNVAVAMLDGKVLALTRAGYLARSSPYEQHHMFAAWVDNHHKRFNNLLQEGERVVGEWLAQAHGTRYDLFHEPFVPFDIMYGPNRCLYHNFLLRVLPRGFTVPTLLSIGGPLSVDEAMEKIRVSGHGALDPVEGAVWRVERKGIVDFITKFVRHDKVNGQYLPDVSGGEVVWNWKDR